MSQDPNSTEFSTVNEAIEYIKNHKEKRKKKKRRSEEVWKQRQTNFECSFNFEDHLEEDDQERQTYYKEELRELLSIQRNEMICEQICNKYDEYKGVNNELIEIIITQNKLKEFISNPDLTTEGIVGFAKIFIKWHKFGHLKAEMETEAKQLREEAINLAKSLE